MACIGGTFKKPLEVDRPPRGPDLGSVHLLQAENVSLETFQLWAEHGGTFLESRALPAEVLEVEGGDAHVVRFCLSASKLEQHRSGVGRKVHRPQAHIREQPNSTRLQCSTRGP